MSDIGNIKDQISTYLAELVTAGTLGYKVVDDYKINIFDRDFPAFPAAILATPSIDSEIESSNGNKRTYTFDIVVLMLGDNVASSTDVETLQEAILDKFDSHPTLNGTAHRSEANVSVPAAGTSAGGKHYIAFAVTLKTQKIKSLSMD